jgi:hypothetical protein
MFVDEALKFNAAMVELVRPAMVDEMVHDLVRA